MSPPIAAIIPAYNRPRSVIEALESVAAQTRPPARLIIVDDGSNDDTVQRVRAWIDRASLTRPPVLIRQPNGGASTARNRGAAEATDCTLLAFLDSDDLWPADYLQRMGDALAAAPDAVAATTNRTDTDYTTGRVVTHNLRHLAGSATRRLLVDGAPWTSNTVLRAEHFKAVGGYDPAMRTGQDWQLMLRLSLLGRWLHVPGVPVSYRLNISATPPEAKNLSAAYDDSVYHRVQMIERFVLNEGGKSAMPEAVWRSALAKRWYKAGRQFTRNGQRARAHSCFRRALHWSPGHLKGWYRVLTTMGGWSAERGGLTPVPTND
ncbi:MAG: glycosyltransferase family 2 protein [Planctomycetes bacterium]|nr:glycosyltransferase family 2 protein [Planctomycetota bacterium]